MRSSRPRPTASCVRFVTQPLLISGLLVTASSEWPDTIQSFGYESNVFQQRHGPPVSSDETRAQEACDCFASTWFMFCRLSLSTIRHPGSWTDDSANSALDSWHFFRVKRFQTDGGVDEALPFPGSVSYMPRAGLSACSTTANQVLRSQPRLYALRKRFTRNDSLDATFALVPGRSGLRAPLLMGS
jgi:hypothetical protein